MDPSLSARTAETITDMEVKIRALEERTYWLAGIAVTLGLWVLCTSTYALWLRLAE